MPDRCKKADRSCCGLLDSVAVKMRLVASRKGSTSAREAVRTPPAVRVSVLGGSESPAVRTFIRLRFADLLSKPEEA